MRAQEEGQTAFIDRIPGRGDTGERQRDQRLAGRPRIGRPSFELGPTTVLALGLQESLLQARELCGRRPGPRQAEQLKDTILMGEWGRRLQPTPNRIAGHLRKWANCRMVQINPALSHRHLATEFRYPALMLRIAQRNLTWKWTFQYVNLWRSCWRKGLE